MAGTDFLSILWGMGCVVDLMVEIVALEGVRIEETWFPILYEDGSVAGIVVNESSFANVLKGTTTSREVRPVYLQQCNITVHSVTDRRLQLFQRFRR
jgi:hypothetical protein